MIKKAQNREIFKRCLLTAGSEFIPAVEEHAIEPPPPPVPDSVGNELNVLVVNASQEMAKEITLQLTLALPGCSITYAPTIELARWVLARRVIGLVVSSPVLPDGGINRLKDALKRLPSPPDLVVVGDSKLKSSELLNDSSYEFAGVKRFPSNSAQTVRGRPVVFSVAETNEVGEKIKTLGADIRNDLNNPLQEIVAMVFVAKSASGQAAPATDQALQAIQQAALNIAEVVNGLEDKIRLAVR